MAKKARLVEVFNYSAYSEKMSNWQRNQWARAGYPKDRESLEKFCALTKNK